MNTANFDNVHDIENPNHLCLEDMKLNEARKQTRPGVDKVKPKGWFKYSYSLTMFCLNMVDYRMSCLSLST